MRRDDSEKSDKKVIILNSRSFHTSESPERCVMLECNVSYGYCAEKDQNKDLSTWDIWLGKEPL